MTVLRKGCDSYAHADPKILTALGFDFAWQYLLGSHDKDLTAAVAQSLRSGGKDIILNAENTATDADGGYNNGVAYATQANQQADALGAPFKNFDGSLLTIIYSVDSQRSTAQVLPYVQGLASVTRGRTVGGYGGTEWKPLKQDGLCKVWGQANAGSWSGWNTSDFPTDPLADFRQHLPTTADGYSFDPQDQISPASACGFWLAPVNDHPAPLPDPPVATEDDMNGLGVALWQPDQIDTFAVGNEGNLVHRWYDANHRNPADPSGWWREVVTGGLMPRSQVIGPVKWPVDGFIHVWAYKPDGSQVECVWNLGAVGAKWNIFPEA